MKLILLWLLASLTGCGGAWEVRANTFSSDASCGALHHYHGFMPLHVSIPEDTDPNWFDVIEHAVEWWQKESPGLLVFDGVAIRPDDDSHFGISFVDVPVQDLKALATTTYQYTILCQMFNTHITVNILHPGKDVLNGNRNIIAHELGHVLGLKHDSRSPLYVMFPYAQSGDIYLPSDTTDDLEKVYKW